MIPHIRLVQSLRVTNNPQRKVSIPDASIEITVNYEPYLNNT